MNEIIPIQTAQDIANAYAISKQEIEEAYAMLARAEQRMKMVLGTVGYSSIEAVSHYCSGAWSSEYHERTSEAIMRRIKSATWKRIIERLGARQIMSSEEQKKLDERLKARLSVHSPTSDAPELDEPTLENITNMFLALTESAEEKIEGLILEVFNFLRPSDSYKTNSKFRIGKKVVIERYGISGYDDEIIAIDRCFHLLDGNMENYRKSYRSPLVEAVNAIRHHTKGEGETEYFKFKTYSNNNLHIAFKRMDIVEKINQIGGRLSAELGKGNGK